MKRAIIIVIDSMGAGAMPDCGDYKDSPQCNTIKNVAQACEGLKLPTMQAMGLGNVVQIQGAPPVECPCGKYGLMREISKGKDTTTGHWEMAGLILDEPFKVYPNGFSPEIIDQFIKETNCGGILGNIPSSGTKIIEDLDEEHTRTKFPIVYTSADSVFQIAVNIDTIPLQTLYEYCEKARNILTGENNVSRVIARPYHIVDGKPTRISKDRKDYSVEPPRPTVLNEILKNEGHVLGIGKIEDIFVKSGISHAIHTGTNKEGLQLTLAAVRRDIDTNSIKIAECAKNPGCELIFTNLVDTDMLFGHRNDAKGYGKALEEIDAFLPKIMFAMEEDDLLIITADHGCDPTMPGTDHTREIVPVLLWSKNIEPQALGTMPSFSFVADVLRTHLLDFSNIVY